MSRIRIAVAGTGYGRRTILPELRKRSVDIVALCGGKDGDKTSKIASDFAIPVWYNSFDKMIAEEDIDLVFIATPHEFHFEMVKAAIKNDLNIVCEKPLSLRVSDMEYLISLSQESNKLNLINHQLRFLPHFRDMKRKINRGSIGRPYYVRISFDTDRLIRPGNKPIWWFRPESGGGMLIAMGTHLIDLIQYWFGNSIADVDAYMAPVLEGAPGRELGLKEGVADSVFQVRMTILDNLIVELFCNGLSYRGTNLKISIYGTEGEIQFESVHDYSLSKFDDSGNRMIDSHSMTSDTPVDNNNTIFDIAFSNFVTYILKRLKKKTFKQLRNNGTTFADYLYQFKILEAIRTSNVEKRVVMVPYK